jgi:uncharacterized protein
MVRAWRLAIAAGFRNALLIDLFKPGAFACYAANPRSFVIGSDGSVYKCTVELDYHDRNIVGKLRPDGIMELDWKKMGLWTETHGMYEGTKCSTCFFSPSCYGAVCPKQWMEETECACPPHKHAVRDVLQVIQLEIDTPELPFVESQSISHCGR